MDDTHQLGESRDRSNAVKLIRVGENTRISRIKKNQDKILQEIQLMKKLFTRQDGKYYFPSLLG